MAKIQERLRSCRNGSWTVKEMLGVQDEAADCLDAMEAALMAIMSNTSRLSAIHTIAREALAKLEASR